MFLLCIIYFFFHFSLSLRRNGPFINLSTKFYKNGRSSWTATLHIIRIFLTYKYGIYKVKTRIKTKPEMHVIDMIRGFLHNLQKSLLATHCDVVYRKIILSWRNALQITNIDLFEEITTRFKLIFEESCLIILYIIYEENSGTRWWLLILE